MENEVKNENDVRKAELEELKKSINTLKGKLTTLESKKKDIEKEADDLIASTIYHKKVEIERSYDEIIKEAEQRLKVVEKEKDDERKKNLKNLIEHSTRNIKENNIYLRNEIKRMLSENELPGFMNSGFYMSLWNPTSFGEMLVSVVALLVVLLIPTVLAFVVYKDALIKTFPNNIIRLIIIILIYLVTIFVAGLIWLAVDKWTKKKPYRKNTLEHTRNKKNNLNIKTISKESKNKHSNKRMNTDYQYIEKEYLKLLYGNNSRNHKNNIIKKNSKFNSTRGKSAKQLNTKTKNKTRTCRTNFEVFNIDLNKNKKKTNDNTSNSNIENSNNIKKENIDNKYFYKY